MVRRSFLAKRIQYASQLALQNVQALLQIVEWNAQHGISVFRVTPDPFPWKYKKTALPLF
jgi:UV DNA damage endonuclease